MWALLVAAGIPTAVTGFLIWLLKRDIAKRDKEKEEREKEKEERERAKEKYIFSIAKSSRATNVLAEATARAVQRIPDARCNGDMKAALEEAEKIQKEEIDFIMDQGIKHIFEK